jgi:uroporphyrinogen decarboxylase
MAIKPCRPKWKGLLTDRERFKRQMHYQEIDRCFNMEFGYWDENFRSWDLFRKNGITNNDDADRFFGFDKISVIYMSQMKFLMQPPFARREISRVGQHVVIINEDGLLAEVPIDKHETIPHFLKSSIVTPDDWQKVKTERFQINESRQIDIETLRRAHPADRDYPLGINTGSMIGKIRDMLTFEGLAYACYDYPDMVEDMVETACQLVEHALDQLLPHFQFDFAKGWEDICFNKGPIVTLDFFREVVVPRYKRINKKLKEHGIDIWYTDCDGDIRPLLPYFLESGINCLFPYEVNSCNHPADLLRQYGRELRIMGGFDKMQLGAGRTAIAAYMKTLEPLVARGGFIPFCDHFCPPNVDEQDYLFYLDLKEATFGLKE